MKNGCSFNLKDLFISKKYDSTKNKEKVEKTHFTIIRKLAKKIKNSNKPQQCMTRSVLQFEASVQTDNGCVEEQTQVELSSHEDINDAKRYANHATHLLEACFSSVECENIHTELLVLKNQLVFDDTSDTTDLSDIPRLKQSGEVNKYGDKVNTKNYKNKNYVVQFAQATETNLNYDFGNQFQCKSKQTNFGKQQGSETTERTYSAMDKTTCITSRYCLENKNTQTDLYFVENEVNLTESEILAEIKQDMIFRNEIKTINDNYKYLIRRVKELEVQMDYKTRTDTMSCIPQTVEYQCYFVSEELLYSVRVEDDIRDELKFKNIENKPHTNANKVEEKNYFDLLNQRDKNSNVDDVHTVDISNLPKYLPETSKVRKMNENTSVLVLEDVKVSDLKSNEKEHRFIIPVLQSLSTEILVHYKKVEGPSTHDISLVNSELIPTQSKSTNKIESITSMTPYEQDVEFIEKYKDVRFMLRKQPPGVRSVETKRRPSAPHVDHIHYCDKCCRGALNKSAFKLMEAKQRPAASNADHIHYCDKRCRNVLNKSGLKFMDTKQQPAAPRV